MNVYRNRLKIKIFVTCVMNTPTSTGVDNETKVIGTSFLPPFFPEKNVAYGNTCRSDESPCFFDLAGCISRKGVVQ